MILRDSSRASIICLQSLLTAYFHINPRAIIPNLLNLFHLFGQSQQVIGLTLSSLRPITSKTVTCEIRSEQSISPLKAVYGRKFKRLGFSSPPHAALSASASVTRPE